MVEERKEAYRDTGINHHDEHHDDHHHNSAGSDEKNRLDSPNNHTKNGKGKVSIR